MKNINLLHKFQVMVALLALVILVQDNSSSLSAIKINSVKSCLSLKFIIKGIVLIYNNSINRLRPITHHLINRYHT